MSEEEESPPWQKYRSGTDLEREDVIRTYFPLVEKVAKQIHRGLPSSVQFDDLVGDGMFGLMKALDTFVYKGYKFETYAVFRIRGEIYDKLRKYDSIPRALRKRTTIVESAIQKLEAIGQPTTLQNVADISGLSVSDVEEVYVFGINSVKIHLDSPVASSDTSEEITVGDVVADKEYNIEQGYDREEMIGVLSEGLDNLSLREKIVMKLYYVDGLSLAEIGEMLDFTESRACQVQNKALSFLRDYCIQASVR